MMESNNTTDLDDLKERWAARDRDLDAIVMHLNRQLLFASHVQPAFAALRWLTAAITFELLFTVAAVALIGSFIADHIGEPRFAVPAIFLDAMALALTATLVAQIVVTRRIDYASPVTAIQRNLAIVRILRIRYVQGIFLAGTLAWPLMLIVVLKQLGIDAYALLGSAYIWANIVAGMAVIPLAIWIAHILGRHASGSAAGRYLADVIGGSSLREATDLIEAIAAFERD